MSKTEGNTVLVTGAAGFIGYHLAERLLADGREVVGLDNLNDYYDPSLKEARLERLQASDGFTFARLDLADREGMESLFAEHGFATVVNLAAQAGVRYSIENPHSYVDSNLVGFLNILEGCRHTGVSHLVYASSSSVYGSNTAMPFSVHDNIDHPLSLYAATKKANELMAHAYSHLYDLPTTGLRFFTVYGPWGRPDMALFKFTKKILADEPIDVFNYGNQRRDFTYIAGAQPRMVKRQPRPGIQPRTLAGLQRRQQPANRAHEIHRGHRGLPRQESREKPPSHATRRCSGYVRGCHRTHRGRGLQAGYLNRGGDWEVC